MAITTIKDVHPAADVRTFVSTVDVSYSDNKIKDKIFDVAGKDPDAFLLVTKNIGSKIVITDVKVLDDDLIDKMVFGD